MYNEAFNNYQKALALARRLGDRYEESKALRNIGIVSRFKKDYLESEARLKDAMKIFGRIGAVYDMLLVYDDMATVALAKGDLTKAEEIAVLLERHTRLMGYSDLNIRALIALADCEIRTGRSDAAINDYNRALHLAASHSNSVYSNTASMLMSRIVEHFDAANLAPDARKFLSSMKSRLQEKDYKGILENLPNALEILN